MASVLVGSALTPTTTAGQVVSVDHTALPGHPAAPTYGAWDDRSDELPGISSGTTVLVVLGAVVVAALVYRALRSDHGDEATEGKEGKESGALLLQQASQPPTTEPSHEAYSDVTGTGHRTHRPALFLDVDGGGSMALWRIGVAWRF